MGRQLYPELDLWKTAKPVLEQWMRERHDPRTRLKQLVEAWPEISDDLAMLPRVLHRALRRIDAEDAAVRRQRRAPVVGAEPRRGARLEQLVVGAALLIAGVLWSGPRGAGVARLAGRGCRARRARARAAALDPDRIRAVTT